MAMKDPFGVRAAGDVSVACQIIHMDHCESATRIDLVTLEPCGGEDRPELPAGSPLTVSFQVAGRGEDMSVLEGVVRRWESQGDVLVLGVADGARGICYEFSDGVEHLVIVLDEFAPGGY